MGETDGEGKAFPDTSVCEDTSVARQLGLQAFDAVILTIRYIKMTKS